MFRAIIKSNRWNTKNVMAFMDNMKGVKRMRNFTWEIFSQTGDVELYLLFKEIEEQDLMQSLSKTRIHEEETDPTLYQ